MHLSCKTLILFSLFLLLLSFSPFVVSADQQSCDLYTFSNGNKYRACNDLQALNSFLHWNYHQETGTVDIAYRHVGIEPSRWVAWAVNPSDQGMVGSQALVAYQNPNGVLRAYTSPVIGYSTRLQEGNLSFQVPKISAAFESNEMVIFATLLLPENMTKINHVWQEGPVKGENNLGMHPLSGDNVRSTGTIDLLSGKVVANDRKGTSRSLLFKRIHGGVNMVSWGTMMPVGAMIARYMKVFQSAGPAWFYAHIICQTTAYAIGILGASSGLYLGLKSHGIQFDAHKNIGITLLVLGLLQVFALKLRPNKDHKYRIYWNIYHHSIGYAVIILSIVNVYEGLGILADGKTWKVVYSAILITLASVAVAMEALTWHMVIKRRRADQADKIWEKQTDPSNNHA